VANPTDDQRLWTKYSERKPETEGAYRWRLQSKYAKGLTVEFVACMRSRWAGYNTQVSPSFDYWDGYKLLVPVETEWAPTEVTCKSYETVGLVLPGVELLPCPFCRIVPFWKGCARGRDGGIFVGSAPHQYNSWWLECCGWTKTPHLEDPRELARRRNGVIRGEPVV
jgi:hypothetical protein